MSVLFTKTSVSKLAKEIAPRFQEEGRKCGYTRIKPLGRRRPDSARMAMIELVGNPIDQWEKRQEEQLTAELGKPTYWQWELKLLQ